MTKKSIDIFEEVVEVVVVVIVVVVAIVVVVVAVNTRTVLAIVPPQGCEAILVEILQSKRYCLLVKTPSRS